MAVVNLDSVRSTIQAQLSAIPVRTDPHALYIPVKPHMISLHILPSTVPDFPDMNRFASTDDAEFRALHARAIAHPDVTEVYVEDLDTGERIAQWGYRKDEIK